MQPEAVAISAELYYGSVLPHSVMMLGLTAASTLMLVTHGFGAPDRDTRGRTPTRRERIGGWNTSWKVSTQNHAQETEGLTF